MKDKIQKTYRSIASAITEKRVALVLFISSIVLMLPMIYCFFFDYANGDDLHEGAAAHEVIVNGGSVREFFAAVIAWFKDDYFGWEGNWSSIILWCLEPSIWGEKVYLVTPWIGMFFLCGTSCIFIIHFYKEYFEENKWLSVSLCSLFLLVLIQNMPSVKNAIFWYTGMVNYIVPFGCGLLSFVLADKYLKEYKSRYLVFVCLLLAYIGGAGYPPIVIVFEVFFIIVAFIVFGSKEKKGLWLGLPLALLTLGFIISALSPGNAVRGGDSYELSISRAVKTIGICYIYGFQHVFDYFLKARFLYIFIPSVALISWKSDLKQDHRYTVRELLIVTAFLFSLFCSVFAPEIYAQDQVSGGVPDIYFWVFLFTLTVWIIYMTGAIRQKYKKITDEKFDLYIRTPVICMLVVLLIVFGRNFLSNTSFRMCYDFIASGALRDFDEQMKERLRILENPEYVDVVLPMMNNEQGPFMHMALIEDPDSYTCSITSRFYGKRSVIAIPREEWMEKYADEYKGTD